MTAPASDDPLRPETLDALFAPRSVCIVGASANANKIGGRPVHFLKKAGYAGKIFLVNASGGMVQGLPSHPEVEAVPEPFDQAIIALPAAQVPQAFAACVAKGVKTVQIFTSGFSEVGQTGRSVQDRLVQMARDANVRLVGPNSLGLFSVRSGFFGTFATALDGAWPRAGSVALATQSGAFGSYAFGLAQGRNVGFSHFIATGNESDVDVSECIAWFARDPNTKVIIATFESVKSGPRLIEALRLARRTGIPVIAMKVGTSEAGAAAAASHTGSLAGADIVYDSVLRQEGAYRAQSIEDMIDVAQACSQSVLPKGDRVGVVTTSGGIGVLLADTAVANGLKLPETPKALQQEMTNLLPFANAQNPVDTSAQLMGDLSLFARILELGLKAGQWDAVVGFLAHVGRNRAHWEQLRAPLFQIRADNPQIPFVLSLLAQTDISRELEDAGFLVFEEPVRAMRAVAAANWIASKLREPPGNAATAATRRVADMSDMPASAINERQAKRILANAGIRCVEDRLARSSAEAAAAGTTIGFPVVMKVVSADILHKSEAGGVLLGIATAEGAEQAYTQIMRNVSKAVPNGAIEGVMVSPTIQGGVETILGVKRDPTFGPVVMFGLGGIFVEVFKDVAFRVAPFDEQAALKMIEEIRGLPLLQGARGRPLVDIPDLARTLSRLSEFAFANRMTLDSIDINPYIALPKQGYAVDASILMVADPHQPMTIRS